MKERLDLFLFEKSLARSRQQAKTMIESGNVSVNGRIITKPSFSVSEEDKLQILSRPKYVGRGGEKLEKAIISFDINLKNKICLDVGASTGGFTDCMLSFGAEKVYAVDVGHDQLDLSLRTNPKVVNLEGTNIKDLSSEMLFGDNIDFISVDVSFISLRKVLPLLKKFISPSTSLVCLFKPQFEIGRTNKGIVRNKKEHIRLLKDFLLFLEEETFCLSGLDFSPIKGGDGNIEFLIYISDTSAAAVDIKKTVEAAHEIGR